MRVLSRITLKSKIHLLNYSGIWYTARHPHITEKYWSYGPRLCTPPCKKSCGRPCSRIFSSSQDPSLLHSPRIRFGLVAWACSISTCCTRSSWSVTPVWCCCSMHPFCPLSDFLIISCCIVVDLTSHIPLHPRTLDCRQRQRVYCLIIFKSPRPI